MNVFRVQLNENLNHKIQSRDNFSNKTILTRCTGASSINISCAVLKSLIAVRKTCLSRPPEYTYEKLLSA